MGALPEGFCPENMQELADAIATRLIVTPNQNFTSFATGSVAPTSNVGPWFKDCETWFVWDDATASYVPMSKGGYDTMEYITVSSNFIVPSFIYRLRISAWGAGGGGADNGAGFGAGGGGGGFASYDVSVLPGQVIPIVIGAAGVRGVPGTAGTATTVLALSAGGGLGGTNNGTTNLGGQGGIATGGVINIRGQSGVSGTASAGGDGGDSPQGGGAGVYNVLATAQSVTGQTPGGGGVGGTSGNGQPGGASGNGAPGAVLIEY